MKQTYVTPSIHSVPSRQIVDAMGHASANYRAPTEGMGD